MFVCFCVFFFSGGFCVSMFLFSVCFGFYPSMGIEVEVSAEFEWFKMLFGCIWMVFSGRSYSFRMLFRLFLGMRRKKHRVLFSGILRYLESGRL